MKITLTNKSFLDIRSEFPNYFYFKTNAWYDNENFAKEKITGTWDVSLEPVENSFNKTWDEQQKLLSKGDEVPPVAVLMWAVIKHHQDTGEYAFGDCYVRTSSRESDGVLVHVGDFDVAGALVSFDGPGPRSGDLGVSFSRRLDTEPMNPESCIPDEASILGDSILERAIGICVIAGYSVTKNV
jgi:hypothetical protein